MSGTPAYIYRGDIYCEDCAAGKTRRRSGASGIGGFPMIAEKSEICPRCRADLDQFGYDMQQCPCGWNAMLPDSMTAEENQEEGIRRSAENGLCSAATMLVLLDRIASWRQRYSAQGREYKLARERLIMLADECIEKDAQIAAARSWLGREG